MKTRDGRSTMPGRGIQVSRDHQRAGFPATLLNVKAITALRVWLTTQRTFRLLTFLAVSAAVSVAAHSQEAAPADVAATPTVEEVVVTGSRIESQNLQSTSPIKVVDSKAIRTRGRTDISDIIMMLPQNYDNGLGQDLGNKTSGLTTAGGVATADLRGLGPNRTLVLVDGVRLGIGSPYTFVLQPAPDLDQIPTFLVDRIEVVTGAPPPTHPSH